MNNTKLFNKSNIFFINVNQHPKFYHGNICSQTCVNSTSLDEL